MMNALLIATVEGFFNFEKNDIEILQSLGYVVHLATNSNDVERPIDIHGVVKHQVNFARSPFEKTNITAYKELCQIVKNEKFDLIHCHTPVGGVMGRIIGHRYHIKTIYTAHGFHFYKGAPIQNWLLFYPIEKALSWWTDILITINQEDYVRAKNKFHAKNISYIPGVGVDTKSFKNVNVDKRARREKFGIGVEDFVFISIGELSKRKNHEVIIRALAQIEESKVKYLIVGVGDLEDKLKMLVTELQLDNRVIFAGYRTDVKELLHIADAFAFPSLQEGLPVALMEAMAVGLPVVCSEIRGNTDLIENGKGGHMYNCYDVNGFAEGMKKLCECSNYCEMSNENRKLINKFEKTVVSEKMKAIYLKG